MAEIQLEEAGNLWHPPPSGLAAIDGQPRTNAHYTAHGNTINVMEAIFKFRSRSRVMGLKGGFGLGASK